MLSNLSVKTGHVLHSTIRYLNISPLHMARRLLNLACRDSYGRSFTSRSLDGAGSGVREDLLGDRMAEK